MDTESTVLLIVTAAFFAWLALEEWAVAVVPVLIVGVLLLT